jgi:hypothetical protein
MRSTGKNLRKAVTALALGFATAAIFTTTASARLGTDLVPGQYAADLEAEQAMIQAPSFSPITNAAELYAGELEPASTQSAEISYLSWGATTDDLGPFKETLANQSTRDGGLAWAHREPVQSVLSGAGVTPLDLARAARADHSAHPSVAGGTVGEWQLSRTEAAKVGVGPAFESKTVETATASASSDGLVDRGELAVGFGLGLILATACAIALALTRDRHRTRMAHS